MSIVSIPKYMMPTNVAASPTLGGITTFDIGAAGEYTAVIFSMPETARVKGFYFRVHSGTGCTVIVTLETVNASGEPNGVVDPAATYTLTIPTSGAGDYNRTFGDGSGFEIAQGTILAFKITYSSGSPSNLFMGYLLDDNANSGLPYVIDHDGSVQPRDSIAPNIAIVTTNDTALQIKHCWPINAVATETYRSSSSPNTIGNALEIYAPCRISGASVWVDADSTGIIKLYDSNGNVLASANVSANIPVSASAFVNEYYFSAAVDLLPGTYYLGLEGTSASADVGLSTMTFPASFFRSGSPLGGASLTYATRNQSTGAWTTTATKQSFIAPILSGFDTGGGGGTSHVFIG